jgi:hypothetical protein
MQRVRDGKLSNGTSDGNGVGAKNRIKFRGQPTIVERLSMTAALSA